MFERVCGWFQNDPTRIFKAVSRAFGQARVGSAHARCRRPYVLVLRTHFRMSAANLGFRARLPPEASQVRGQGQGHAACTLPDGCRPQPFLAAVGSRRDPIKYLKPA
eukprot:scaffold1514_cov132-Isochrysis_galbana.AAC.2